MSNVAISISTLVTFMAEFGILTENNGTCTIIYIPFIMPQTYESAPFMSIFTAALTATAACVTVYPVLMFKFVFFFFFLALLRSNSGRLM